MPTTSNLLRTFSLISSIFLSTSARAMSSGQALWSVEFEVFGIVQGVFFRKYTDAQAKKLGIRGWCQNSPKGTVVGVIEGEETNYKMMKEWLARTGSPQSRIDSVEWKNEQKIDKYTFDNFSIKR